MAQLIAFRRGRDQAGGWRDGLLQSPPPPPPAAPPPPGPTPGEEARRFYESLWAKEPPPAAPAPPPPPPPPPPPSPPRPAAAAPSPAAPPSPRRGHALLRAAQEGEVETLRRLLEGGGCPSPFRDAFGWTPLMCAARAGRGRAVRYLLRRGGAAAAGAGEAAALAEAAGHRQLARLLREGEGEGEPPPAAPSRCPSPTFCPTCGTHFRDPPARHRRSTAHLLAGAGPPPLPPPAFHIPPTNVGFRLLLRGGWDGRGGLGRAGEGPRSPVRTRLKRDRGGLGCPGGARPRVTHFGPGDAAAVAGPPRGGGGAAAGGGAAPAPRSEAAARAWERRLRAYMGP